MVPRIVFCKAALASQQQALCSHWARLAAAGPWPAFHAGETFRQRFSALPGQLPLRASFTPSSSIKTAPRPAPNDDATSASRAAAAVSLCCRQRASRCLRRPGTSHVRGDTRAHCAPGDWNILPLWRFVPRSSVSMLSACNVARPANLAQSLQLS